jgi:hypothetical protein
MEKIIMWRRQIIVILFLSGLFTSCIFSGGYLVDITAPEINVNTPQAWDELATAEFIIFDATFMDDLELGSYSIDVHDNLDGHGHGRIAQPKDDPALERWIFKKNYSIPEGYIMFVAQHDDDILVPENTMAGPYHFIVQAVDQAGNATNYQDGSTIEFEVLITNSSQPIVNITNLVDGELEIEEGVRFQVEGNISDPTTGDYSGMHSMEVLLGEDHEEEHEHVHGGISLGKTVLNEHDGIRQENHPNGRISQDENDFLIDVDYEGSELEVFMIEGVIQLDQVFESIDFTLSQQQLDELMGEDIDHLILSIKVKDEQGNLTISRTVVHIHI